MKVPNFYVNTSRHYCDTERNFIPDNTMKIISLIKLIYTITYLKLVVCLIFLRVVLKYKFSEVIFRISQINSDTAKYIADIWVFLRNFISYLTISQSEIKTYKRKINVLTAFAKQREFQQICSHSNGRTMFVMFVAVKQKSTFYS